MYVALSSHRFAKIVATLGPSTWTPEGMSRLLASDIDVVRFNVKHQTPSENQMLLEMWRTVAQTSWENTQQRLGIRGMVRHDASPVGIMVRNGFSWNRPADIVCVGVNIGRYHCLRR